MRKISRHEVSTPSKSRVVLVSRSQSIGTLVRLPVSSAHTNDPKPILEDHKFNSRLSPIKAALPRNSSLGALKPLEQAVLRAAYRKPTAVLSHRLSVEGSLQSPVGPGRLQPAIQLSPQKGVAGSSRELLQFLRTQNASSGPSKLKTKQLATLETDLRFPESEPNTSRRKELTASPPTKSRKTASKLPESGSNHSLTLPKVIVRFAHKTRTGSIEGIPKPQNQDSFLILHDFCACKNQFLFGVYDGHGVNGHLVSDYIKKNLPHVLDHHFPRLLKKADSGLNPAVELNALSSAFVATYVDIHHDLMRKSRVDCTFSGSTAVTVLIRGNSAVCANAGDSRAVLGMKREGVWLAVPLSNDHKPDDPSERGRIEQMGGRVEPFKGNNYADMYGAPIGPARVWLQHDQIPGLAMSRSIGDFVAGEVGVISEPDIQQLELTNEHKFLVLASDGIWEFLSNQAVIELVAQFWEAGNIEGACERAVKEAVIQWRRVRAM